MLVPNPFKPPKRVVAIVSNDEGAATALEAGAHAAGGAELAAQVVGGALGCDVMVADLDALPLLKPQARFLRQLMPNPKRGTAGDDIAAMVREITAAMPYRSTSTGHVASGFGKVRAPPAAGDWPSADPPWARTAEFRRRFVAGQPARAPSKHRGA